MHNQLFLLEKTFGMTTSIDFFTASGVHGYYGMNVHEIGTGFTRSEAVRAMLVKIAKRLQKHHQERLRNEVEGIVDFLQTHDRWKGGESDGESVDDEYLHIVVECNPLQLSILDRSDKKQPSR